jgi:hypothetical protein
MAKGDLREVERALLLKRCREGEEDCRHKRECGGHACSLRRICSRVQSGPLLGGQWAERKGKASRIDSSTLPFTRMNVPAG